MTLSTASLPESSILRETRSNCGNPLPVNDEGRQTMNILLWVLQVLAALVYAASGYMKLFMFDKISGKVASFAALPPDAWMALGILELVCVSTHCLLGVPGRVG